MAGRTCEYCGGSAVGFGQSRCNTETCYLAEMGRLRARLALAESALAAADDMRNAATGFGPGRSGALVEVAYEQAREAFDRAANPETERGTPVANAQETAAEAGKPSNR